MASGVGTKARKQLNSADICKGRRTGPSRERKGGEGERERGKEEGRETERENVYVAWLTLSTHVRQRSVFGTFLRSRSLESSIRSAREKLCTGPEDVAIYYSGFCSWEFNDGTARIYSTIARPPSDGFLNVLFQS